MTQILTYKTSFFSDNYQIQKDSLQIGKLYKTEWMGTTIDTSLNEQKFRFASKGLFRPTISILDLSTNIIVGTIKFQHLLIYENAILILSNGTKYNWICNKIFTNDWQWTDLNNEEIIFTKEPLGMFTQNGTITFNNKTLDAELFITLGIHLRNISKRKTLLPKIIGFVIISILLFGLFK